MKKKKWIFWAGLIVMIAVVSIGSVYMFTRSHEKTKKSSTVQSSLKVSEKKVEEKVSKPLTDSLTSESTTQTSQTEKMKSFRLRCIGNKGGKKILVKLTIE